MLVNLDLRSHVTASVHEMKLNRRTKAPKNDKKMPIGPTTSCPKVGVVHAGLGVPPTRGSFASTMSSELYCGEVFSAGDGAGLLPARVFFACQETPKMQMFCQMAKITYMRPKWVV